SHDLSYARPIDLTTASDPQVVCWYRGVWSSNVYLNLEISQNGGLSWVSTRILNSTSVDDWTRFQLSLADYTGETILLRLRTYTTSYARTQQGRIGAVTVQERPAAVTQDPLQPAVRAMTLAWSASSLGADFDRYEIYRSTSSGEGLSGTLVATIDDAATTTFTDTGLAVGQLYYYSVYVVNSDAIYSLGAERAAATVPVSFPFTDTMDSLDSWMPEGTWGIQAGAGRSGGDALASHPEGDFSPNQAQTSALTAINLTGALRPVLTYWQRYDLGEGGQIKVEVSRNGSSWDSLYATAQADADWRQVQLDLSAYRDEANLRIRFNFASNGSSAVGDGWRIDDLRIEEHPGTPATLPIHDDFAAGTDEWITGGWSWREDPGAPGGYSMADTPDGWIDRYTSHDLSYARPIDLTTASDPQVVFWYRGVWGDRVYLHLEVSQNGGLSWDSTRILSSTSVEDWTRFQLSLADYTGETILLRLRTYTTSYARTQQGRIGAVTVQERIAAPDLHPVSTKTIDSLGLSWDFVGSSDFAAYHIYRGSSTDVDENSTLVAGITDPAVTQWTDTALAPQTTYYYRLYSVNQYDGTHGSGLVSGQTLALDFPWESDFSEGLPTGIILQNGWVAQAEGGPDDSGLLRSSLGDYAPGADYQWQTGLDLREVDWPVLRFDHQFDLGSGDYAYVDVSTNRGSSWQTIYSAQGRSLDAWRETRLDLSPWAEAEELWLRFRLTADTDADIGQGWMLHSLEFLNNQSDPSPTAFEEAEPGLANWIASGWSAASDEPHSGDYYLRSTTWDALAGENSLTLGSPLQLPAGEDSLLTYWVRANLARYHYFAMQVSTDDGENWTNLNETSLTNTSVPDWTKVQVNLSQYAGQSIRFRLRSYISSGTWRTGTVDIDRLGIGPEAPAAPLPSSPIQGEVISTARPVLTLTNAIDFQGDALNYRFEVYADAALTDLRAQIPSVASGSEQTSWQVDIDLPNEATFYWRAQAFDGEDYSEWSSPAFFHRSYVNEPPHTVTLAGPANDAVLLEADSSLFFYPTTDPNINDQVVSYELQLASDPDFETIDLTAADLTLPAYASPELPYALRLYDLPGASELPPGRYYWRVRAQDTYGAASAWSAELAYFQSPSHWERWQAAHFTEWERLDPSLSGPEADPQASNISNLMRFACGIPFGSNNREALPTLEMQNDGGNDYLALRLWRDPDAAVDIQMEASSDLQSWTPVPYHAERTDILGDGREVWILSDEQPIHLDKLRFIRLNLQDAR
ncbi:MAG: choice-of-anchor J domain-containing protein, partial [Opitutales bacterium]